MGRRQFVRVSGTAAVGSFVLNAPQSGASSRRRDAAELLLHGGIVVTMDAKRRVFRDGAIAVREGAIVDIGSSASLLARWTSSSKIDLSGFVATPGLINSHIHITGDQLLPGLRPDDSVPSEHLTKWGLPAYQHSRPEDDRAAARFVALQMLRQGSTGFIEAGTCRHPAAVLDGLADMGIRGSIGTWAGDRWPEPGFFSMTTDQALRRIHDALALPQERVQVWPDVLGTAICSDDLYQGAARLAREFNRHWTFHMSPSPSDITAYRARTGRDPLVQLDHLGVLDDRCVVGHAIHISDAEVAALNRSGATVVFSPHSALRLSSGVTVVGRHPDLKRMALGTDALSSNHVNILNAAALACNIYAEARKSYATVTAERALEWLIPGGANALGWLDRTGTLEVGKWADIAVFDVGVPVYNVANALVHSSPRAVHVFIEGKQVVHDGHVKGEQAIHKDAVEAARRVAQRSGLPLATGWPLLD
ncbi:MAG: amidohydrolase family protein [Pyrinomonadaceae bacterium]|nr:amidohydrolase family protein [Pyrinomonadaceae bacterium]